MQSTSQVISSVCMALGFKSPPGEASEQNRHPLVLCNETRRLYLDFQEMCCNVRMPLKRTSMKDRGEWFHCQKSSWKKWILEDAKRGIGKKSEANKFMDVLGDLPKAKGSGTPPRIVTGHGGKTSLVVFEQVELLLDKACKQIKMRVQMSADDQVCVEEYRKEYLSSARRFVERYPDGLPLDEAEVAEFLMSTRM